MMMITASSDAIFERRGALAFRPPAAWARRACARHNRVARIHSGRASWRTGVRAGLRRVWPQLRRSDEEILIDMRCRQEFGCVDWLRQPVAQLRLLRPLPDPMLAADGRTRFRYFKVQKAACTSVVRMLVAACGRSRDLQAEQRVSPYLAHYVGADDAGPIAAVNGAGWPGEPFFFRFRAFDPAPRAQIRFCVVREPVERFVAAFDAIVMRRRFYAPCGLEAFVARIEAGRAEAEQDRREVRVGAFARDMHFRAQHFSLGQDAAYFTHIFNLRQLPQLQALLSELASKPIRLLHANVRPNADTPAVSAPLRRRIEAIYAEDYRIFGRYF